MKQRVYYFVEGQCEKTLIDLIKSNEFNLIVPGVCKVLNVLTHKISTFDLQNLKAPNKIILIYDTDEIDNLDILQFNLSRLKKTKAKIINLHSVLSFEDEIVRSTNVDSLNKIFKTSSVSDFKIKFITCKNLKYKLESLDFDINKMWITKSKLSFLQNTSREILNS